MEDIRYILGVDVSKGSLDCHLLPSAESFSVENTERGRASLLARLSDKPQVRVVLEATGAYERPLVADLAAAKISVAVVNARCVRDFAKALGVLAKTDRIDAAVIARFGQQVNPPPTAVASPKHANSSNSSRAAGNSSRCRRASSTTANTLRPRPRGRASTTCSTI